MLKKLALLSSFVTSLSAAERPNILFVLADDLGIMDINSYAKHFTGEDIGRMYYETPHIDRLASQGLSFSQAYSYQLCSPTRASLLTGRNAPEIGITTATPPTARSFHALGRKPPAGYLAQDAVYWGDPIKTPQALLNGSTLLALPSGRPEDMGRDETTFAEALPDYRSAFIGKWHLGGHGSKGYQPQDQGFETIAYYDAGGSPFFNWRKDWDRTEKFHPEMNQDQLVLGKSGEETGENYLTDDLTVQAERFIRHHHQTCPEQPFLLYLCHFAVHTPIHAKKDDIDYFKNKSTRGWNGHKDPVYAAMIRSLDDSIGRLVATLDELDLTKDTLIIFMSDNGGISWTSAFDKEPITCNTPFKGGKAMMFEGGIRVPLIFRWPGKIPAATWSDTPVAAADMFPTIVQSGGVDPAVVRTSGPIDGQSLVPLFNDPSNQRKGYTRDTFYWHYPFNVVPLHPDDGLPLTPHSAIRKGDMKLIHDWNGRLYLHDIRKDPYERDNLAEKHPDLTRALFRELNELVDSKVDKKYTPALNPDYSTDTEVRIRPFEDLRRHLLGSEHAIRTAKEDPRLEELIDSKSE